ncbi:MAG: hypothetical protein IJX51_01365 [Clostridia bacterium]|nr:hypothetical protein [Clostridia bacterium]
MTDRKKTGKAKKTSFNIVDVLILAVFLFFVAYIVYAHVFGYSLENFGATKVNVEYTVKIDNVPSEYFHKIASGDPVKSSDGSVTMGTVVKKYSISDDGSATIVIQSSAYRSNRSYTVGGQTVDPGTELEIRFPDYAPSTKVKCVGIKVIENVY